VHRLPAAAIVNGGMGGAIATNANMQDAVDVGGDRGGSKGCPRGGQRRSVSG
jgi:hypothetical protein